MYIIAILLSVLSNENYLNFSQQLKANWLFLTQLLACTTRVISYRSYKQSVVSTVP